MKLKRLLTACLVMTIAVATLAGCGGTKSDPNAITIRYFVGGYGEEWLKDAMAKYTAETGVTFNPIEDDKIKANMSVYLERNVPDIIMSDSFNWEESVYMGKIEPLDEVFETEVNDGKGAKVKVKDFLADELQEWPYMQRLRGQGEEHPWVLPWTALSTGLIYNDTMLKTIPKTGTDGTWQAPPATFTELIQYCTDVEKAGKVAIAWSGGAMHWWMMPMYVWWAQLQGVKESNIDGEGSWYDFWDFATKNTDGSLKYTDGYDVWKQSGISESLDYLSELFIKNGDYQFSPKQPDGLEGKDGQRLFVQGDAAMVLCGSWIENEMEEFIKEGVTMKLMPMPAVEGAAVNPETGKPYTIDNAQTGDLMLIPKKADKDKKAESKKFLAWLCNAEQMSAFTQASGTMRPYKYDPLELAPDYQYSEFNKSVFSNYINSDFRLYEMSLNQSDTFKYMRKHVFNHDAKTAFLKLKKGLTGREVMVTGNKDKDPDWMPLYEVFKEHWQKELDQFKIT